MDLLEKILKDGKANIKEPVLILEGKNWHEGVIGIVAARLKDKFNKPAIIISINGDIGKASARSIIGFDIGSAIIAATQEKILLKGGGHKMAGGFTLNKIIEKNLWDEARIFKSQLKFSKGIKAPNIKKNTYKKIGEDKLFKITRNA